MGSMLLSECKCGFQFESLSGGGGMMDFGSKCWTPFSCSQCKSEDLKFQSIGNWD